MKHWETFHGHNSSLTTENKIVFQVLINSEKEVENYIQIIQIT